MAETLTESSPFTASPVIPNLLPGDKVIHFSCYKGISCFNACCSNIDITLTPYDIIRLKNRLDMSSSDFLNQYTVPFEFEKDGIAGVKFRPVDEGTACRFMTPEGCSVYSDRPTACRYYPVGLVSLRRQDEFTDHNSFALVQEAHCNGHQEPRAITIDDYRTEQGVTEYDELGRGWRQLILKKKSSGPTIGKPSLRSRQLFFMACYDIDRFRTFVASDGFQQSYEIEAERMAKMLMDDVALMLFSFDFLKHTLFGEPLLHLKEGVFEQRLAKERELLQERISNKIKERNVDADFEPLEY